MDMWDVINSIKTEEELEQAKELMLLFGGDSWEGAFSSPEERDEAMKVLERMSVK